MKQFVKRQLKNGFPEVITAYHYYRDRKQYQKMESKKSGFGFKLIGAKAMQDGTYEPEETAVLIEKLQYADVFVDIGANIGYFSCIACQKGIKTIMVEPLSENLNILYANLKINGWEDLEVFPVGLAGKPGLADLYGGGTGASLSRGWAGTSDLWKRTISVTTLDTILGVRFAEKRLLIKMDVEGAEHEVLKGARATLRMHPKPIWLVEICFTENQPQSLNPNFLDTFNLFWENGYQATALGPDGRVVTPEDVQRWVATRARDFGYVSYLFEAGK